MGQIFDRRSNTLARAAIAAGLLGACGGGWLLHAVWWSPYATLNRVPREQPVPFSHQHHAGQLGIDCRYCHASVEKSAFAGLPATEVCMSCHSQLWATAPLLAPVRQSLTNHIPLRWTRVHDLPDFAYFNHRIHLTKGVGCETCHGRVDLMPLTWQEHMPYMKWCLECHKDPGAFLRPTNRVFEMNWHRDDSAPSTPGPEPVTNTRNLAATEIRQLTDCSICHR